MRPLDIFLGINSDLYLEEIINYSAFL